jgi:hypothetical protein
MEYKASLDSVAKSVTWGVFILFLLIAFGCIWIQQQPDVTGKRLFGSSVVVVLCLVFWIGTYGFSPQSYWLEDGVLTVKRAFKSRKIYLDQISEIRPVEEGEMKRTVRTFGSGGLFGYFGKFYNSTFGSMTWYATKRKEMVLIVLKRGEKIIITPDDFAIIAAVQTMMGQGDAAA